MYPRIRDLREDRDLTQTQVAKMLSMSQTGYSKYETGENDIPTAILIRLARFYGTSVDYLLGETAGRSERRSAARYVPYRKKRCRKRKNLRFPSGDLFLCGTAPCRAGHVLSAACVRAVHVRRITAFRSAGTR